MIRDQLHLLRHRAAAAITSPDISIWRIVGGGWGLIDVLGPHLLFLTVYLITQDFVPAIGIALASALALLIIRLATGRAVKHAIGGTVLVAVSGLIATATGHEADFYLMQVLRSLLLAAILLASLAVGRPLVGVIVGPVIGGPSWRQDPILRRAYWQCTAIWAGIALARTMLKVPLYVSNSVVGLGAAHLITGIPLFAAMIYWQLHILRRAYQTTQRL
jgi:intracellular septation protein A